ncbi:hypothetical protein OIO90_006161 [Microbotryomycetes sp. JL221]|nr:hypothetical protein OIO90_006161 [Microbotryomycetes sp. JL221]
MAPSVPLYLFQLPQELLNDLQVRELHIPESHPLYEHHARALEQQQQQQQTQPATSPNAIAEPQSDAAATGGRFTCAVTQASFPDLVSLRQHYKTDWYKYNVKLKLEGKPTPVSEQDFEALVDGLSASISGSGISTASSDDDSDATDSSTNAVSRLLRKQRLTPKHGSGHNADSDQDEAVAAALQGGPRSALIWFEAPNVNPGTQYGVYKAALPQLGSQKRAQLTSAASEIKELQLPSAKEQPEPQERKWTMLMFGGGHFAGMVVSLVPKLISKGKGKEKEREVVVLAKKTFHRYTTRRKQGGAQSANDSGKGKAKSAGAQIRRYNEAMLTDEVRELLTDWQELIDETDPRIRGFSFPTRRPTLNELVRSFTELTRVKTSHLSVEALAQLDADYLASITPAQKPAQTAATTKPAVPLKPAAPKLTRAEELERDRWTRLVDMVKRGKIEALSSFLDKYGPELEHSGSASMVWGTLPSWMDESKALPTLLHVASAADQSDMVKWLLVEKRADPTLRPSSMTSEAACEQNHANADVTKGQQTPYELAPSRATRNVFRLLTTEHPEWWDWTGTGVGGARVPSGLDVEKEQEREQKTKDRRAMLRDKLKERDRERAEKDRVEQEKAELERSLKEQREAEERANKPVSGGKPTRLGGGPPQAFVNRQQTGLTEAQKARIEREQRARAAEARLTRLGG